MPNNISIPNFLEADVHQIFTNHGLFFAHNGEILEKDQTNGMIEINGKYYPASQCQKCPECNEHFAPQHSSNTIQAGGSRYCTALCTHNAGYRYNEDYGDWAKAPKLGQVGKFGYKQTTKVSTTCEKHPFLIGLEIEKEDTDTYNQLKDYKKGVVLPKNWIIVHDGTLSEANGFELVSHGYNLTRERKEMLAAIHSIKDILDGNTTSKCGGHISISERGKTAKQLGKEIQPLICLFLGLYPNRMQHDSIRMRNWLQCTKAKDKYHPVKLDKNGRVELRMISAVKSEKSLMRRIKVIEWFLLHKPGFIQTKEAMMDGGFLQKEFSNVYGPERWKEKIDNFKKMSMWFCWNIKSMEPEIERLTQEG